MDRNRLLLAALALSAAGTMSAPALLAGDQPKAGDGGAPVGKDGAPDVVGKVVGKDISDIQLAMCLNNDGRTTVADHRGEVVLVDLWSTTCAPCRGLIPTFSKHQEEMGRKGLQVIGITGESKDVLTKFLTQVNVAPVSYKMASGSSGGLLSPGTVPYCFVIDVEGRVVWQGHGAPPPRIVEGELKRVKPATAEQVLAKAQKSLDRAADLAGRKLFLQATELLQKVVDGCAGTEAGKTATDRLKEIQAGADSALELAAQKALAKVVGGSEVPAKKLSKKERQGAVTQIEAILKKEAAKAPATQELAKSWIGLLGADEK